MKGEITYDEEVGDLCSELRAEPNARRSDSGRSRPSYTQARRRRLSGSHLVEISKPDEGKEDRNEGCSHPSSNLATTIPLPPRADNRKPALTTVKIANPFACSRTGVERGRSAGISFRLIFRPPAEEKTRGKEGSPCLGMTRSRPLLVDPSIKELTENVGTC
jgi:hypothetical protein